MRNLHDLLAEEAGRQQPTAVPSFETLITRSARRRTRWGAGIALAAAAAVTVVVAATVSLGRYTDPAASRSPARLEGPTAVFAGDGVTFRYPVYWRPQQFPAQAHAAFFDVITHLSTDTLFDPCRTSAPGETICDWPPPTALSPGGVLVTWTRWSTLAPHRLSDQPGRQTTLNGHPASITATSATAGCAAVGATQEVHAIIVLDPATPYRHWLDMSACLAAPDAAHSEMQINEMLASLRVAAGP